MACLAGTSKVANFIIITSGKDAAPVLVYRHLPVREMEGTELGSFQIPWSWNETRLKISTMEQNLETSFDENGTDINS